jgi:hypothetical protein
MVEKGVLGDPWILIRGALFLRDAQTLKTRCWVEEEQANCRIILHARYERPVAFMINNGEAWSTYRLERGTMCISDDGSVTRLSVLVKVRKGKTWSSFF